MKKDLENVKMLINEYCSREFGRDGDFSDLKEVDLAYTTIDNPDFLKRNGVIHFYREFELQISANLVDYEIITFIDGDEIKTEKFDSLDSMEDALEGLTFDDLIRLDDDSWQKIVDKEVNREAEEHLNALEAAERYSDDPVLVVW